MNANLHALTPYFALLRWVDSRSRVHPNENHMDLKHLVQAAPPTLNPALNGSGEEALAENLLDRMQDWHRYLYQDSAVPQRLGMENAPPGEFAPGEEARTYRLDAMRNLVSELTAGGFFAPKSAIGPEERLRVLQKAWTEWEGRLVEGGREGILFPYGSRLVLNLLLEDLSIAGDIPEALRPDFRRLDDQRLRELHMAELLADSLAEAPDSPLWGMADKTDAALPMDRVLDSMEHSYIGSLWETYCDLALADELKSEAEGGQPAFIRPDTRMARALRNAGFPDSQGEMQVLLGRQYQQAMTRDERSFPPLRDNAPEDRQAFLRERSARIREAGRSGVERMLSTRISAGLPLFDRPRLKHLLRTMLQGNRRDRAGLHRAIWMHALFAAALDHERAVTPGPVSFNGHEQRKDWEGQQSKTLAMQERLEKAAYDGPLPEGMSSWRDHLPLQEDARLRVEDFVIRQGENILYVAENSVLPETGGCGVRVSDDDYIVLADGGAVRSGYYFAEVARLSRTNPDLTLDDIRFSADPSVCEPNPPHLPLVRYDVLGLYGGGRPEDAPAELRARFTAHVAADGGVAALDLGRDLVTGLGLKEAKDFTGAMERLPLSRELGPTGGLDVRRLLEAACPGHPRYEPQTERLIAALCGDPKFSLAVALDIDTDARLTPIAPDPFRSNVDYLMTTYEQSGPRNAKEAEDLADFQEAAENAERQQEADPVRAEAVANAENQVAAYLMRHLSLLLGSPELCRQLQQRLADFPTLQRQIATVGEHQRRSAGLDGGSLQDRLLEYLSAACQQSGRQVDAEGRPLAIFTMGGGGTGKGTFEQYRHNDPANAGVMIGRDASRDDWFPQSYRAQNIVDHGGDWQDMVTSINSMHRMIMDAFGLNVSLHNDGSMAGPGSGWEKYRPKLEESKGAGYSTVVLVSVAPTEEAMSRARKRKQETGRPLAPDVLRAMHSAASVNFVKMLADIMDPRPGAVSPVDYLEVVDNSRGQHHHCTMAHSLRVTAEQLAELQGWRDESRREGRASEEMRCFFERGLADRSILKHNSCRPASEETLADALRQDYLVLGGDGERGYHILAIQDVAAFRQFVLKGMEYLQAESPGQLTFPIESAHLGLSTDLPQQQDRIDSFLPLRQVEERELAEIARQFAGQDMKLQNPILAIKQSLLDLTAHENERAAAGRGNGIGAEITA